MARVVKLFFPVFLISVHSHALASQATVDPPTNLTLYCRNLRNVLTWSYDKQPPGLKFKVIVNKLSGAPDVLWVNPPALQMDLSFLSESDQDYYLTVTAVVEGAESARSEGIIFSYFKDSPGNQKCFVDLPTVNVTAPKQDIIKFSFVHPWQFHKHNLDGDVKPGTKKRRSHDPQLPEFEYSVVITNQTGGPFTFICEESVCEESLPVDAAHEQYCLEITGEMDKISVKATQDYCAAPFVKTPPGNDYYIYIIVACVLFGIISAIFCMVVLKKTKASSSFPDAINVSGIGRPLTLRVDAEQAMMPEVESRSPTPLLLATDTTEDTPVSVPELNCRYPIGVLAEEEGACEGEEAQNARESGYMHGGNLDDGEALDNGEIHSGYETRPVLVSLASDELAQGYRG